MAHFNNIYHLPTNCMIMAGVHTAALFTVYGTADSTTDSVHARLLLHSGGGFGTPRSREWWFSQ